MEAKELQDKAVDHLTATILDTATTSDAILLYGTTLVALETPAVLDGTSFTFEGSIDKGVTFKEIRDVLGTAISVIVAVDGATPLDANIFAPYDQVKLVSGSAETADRSIKVKPFAL